MSKSHLDGFGEVAIDQQPRDLLPEIDEKVQPTLARLLGWESGVPQFRLIEVDSDGRILVSTDPTKVSDGTISHLSITATTQVVLGANSSRKYWFIRNDGVANVSFSFVTPVGSANFITLPAGGTFSDSNYTGAIYALGTVGDTLQIIEV